jgi:SAM-dependent methyltransferase
MKEEDIRPAALFQKYLELSAADASTYFAQGERHDLPCPGCGLEDVAPAFVKHGFGFAQCTACGTLYQSPRPLAEAFYSFYQESLSARYWSQVFFPAVAESRRLHLFRPKVQELARLCRDSGFFPTVVVDVGAGYGLLLEEWVRAFPDTRAIALEPNPELAAACRGRGLEVLEIFAEEARSLKVQADLVTAFEVIEHVHQPLRFCQALAGLLRPGGRLLLTGPTVDGFDIQVLWHRSNSVVPPHHLNMLSVLGFESLLERAGFIDVRIFTPGKLDVDIVNNALSADAQVLQGQRFVRTLLGRGQEDRAAFQKFLSEHRLSSHCWAWAVKANG